MGKQLLIMIPGYNEEESIGVVLNKIYEAGIDEIGDILVINDGSQDNSKVIAKSYLFDDRVRYVYKENKGFSTAINRGITESKGDLVGFIGQDDLWMPYKLDVQVNYFLKNKTVDFVHSNYHIIDSNGDYIGTRKIKIPKKDSCDKFIQELFLRNYIGFETVLIRKNCFLVNGFFDERMVGFSDHDMWLRLAITANIQYINLPVVKKREHTEQLTKKTYVVNRDEFLMVNKMLNLYPFLRAVERKKIAALYYGQGIHALLSGNYKQSKKEFKKVVRSQPWALKAIVAYFVPRLYVFVMNHVKSFS